MCSHLEVNQSEGWRELRSCQLHQDRCQVARGLATVVEQMNITPRNPNTFLQDLWEIQKSKIQKKEKSWKFLI